MFRVWMLVVVGTAPLASQIAVTPVRIAGLAPANWPIGDGGPAVNALLSPYAMTWDRAGNLLIADYRNQRIRQMTPDGKISTLFNLSGALFVVSMAVDSVGNLYCSVSASSYPYTAQIFQFSPTGIETEIPNPGSSVSAPAISAPALAIDAADNLYITDDGMPGGSGFVWKRSPSGSVVRIAGSGASVGIPSQRGPALQVILLGPHALAFDRSFNLLIADSYGVLRLNPDGTLVRLFAGWAQRVAAAADGSIYFIGDFYGIWRWDPTNQLTAFAGTQQSHFSDGCALSGGSRVAKYASMNPSDLVFDTAGRLYVADDFIDPTDPGSQYSSAGRVRRIDTDGSIRTVAGTGSMPLESPPGGSAIGAIFHNPESLAVDGAGNVYFAESGAGHVHEITAAGRFLTVAGSDSPPAGEDPACYTATGTDLLAGPRGIAMDAGGNLYISDSGNNRILRRSADGTITTIASAGVGGQPAISGPAAMAVKPDGSVYFVTNGSVLRIGTDGVIESAQAPPGIGWLAVGFDGRLILSGSKLYKEGTGGVFYALRNGVGEFTVDPAGAVYGLSNPLFRISANCNESVIIYPQVPISQYPQGLASDLPGNVYLSADNSVWRIAAVAPPATDQPSIYLDNPGVFNAASNLAVTVTTTFYFHTSSYEVNDSVTGNEILLITGGCMGPLEPSQSSIAEGSLLTSVQGTQVLFDGEAAPLLSVQATEILAIAPQDVASKSKVTVAVENQGVPASTILNVSTVAPGIFVSSGTQASAINEDGSLNGTDHPTPVGSVISLYLTGAGLTNPPTSDGVLPDLPLPQLALPVSVQVGGVAAEVVYAGSVFRLPGMAQVNIRVPAVAASDAVPVQVSIGGYSRNQPVTIAVR